MNYVAEVRAEVAEATGCSGMLLDLYTLLVFTKGKFTTLEDVHDAWSVWKNAKMPDHRSLIPYDELTLEVQELDRDYANAIIKVAKEIK